MVLRMAYEFGTFQVDPSTRVLSCGGRTLVVPPKAFDVLVFLIRHRDQVVTREQLLSTLWSDCVVEDATLSQHIYLLRRVLRLNAEHQEVIATVARRGYRFVLPVTERVGPGTGHHESVGLVGRERELADLHGWLARAMSGSRIVCISGEPGIGKTALIDAFLQGLSLEADVTVGRSRCSERFGSGETYLPILDVLDDLRRRNEGRVALLLRTRAPRWLAQIDPDVMESASRGAPQSPDLFKRELCAFLEDLSRQTVIVIVVDDWHWASESTVELLTYLASRSDRMRLLLILAYRPAELMSRNGVFIPAKWDWQAEGVCHELALGPLTAVDVEHYVACELRPHGVPAGLGAFLYARTEGNPLFMVDLLKHMHTQQMLLVGEGDWTVSPHADARRYDLPESTRCMIDRVLGGLRETDRQILREASVQGGEFDSAVLAEVSGRDATEIERQLDALRHQGVVTTTAGRNLAGGGGSCSYGFRHVLYQNVLYDSIGAQERAGLSRITADALLRRRPDSRGLSSRLAKLMEASGDVSRAVALYARAAQEATAISAFRDAIDLAGRGLQLLAETPGEVCLIHDELQLQLTLGAAIGAREGYGSAKVRQAYDRAYQLCRDCEHSVDLVPTFFGLWSFYGLRGEFSDAALVANDLLAVAATSGDDLLLARAYACQAGALVHLGELRRGCELIERALALNSGNMVPSIVLDIRVHLLSHLAQAISLMGFHDQAVERANEAVAIARRQCSPFSIVLALDFAALVHRDRRDVSQALECAEEAIVVATKFELGDGLAWGRSLRAWSLSQSGRADQGLLEMRELMDAQRLSGRNPQYFFGMFGEVLAAAGAFEEATAAIETALAAAERVGDVYCVPELLRLKGDILTAVGETTRAETCLVEAIRLAAAYQTKTLEWQAAASLARLLNSRGARNLTAATFGGVYESGV